MQKLRLWIRRYFGFSRRETNGFFLLLLIIVLAVAAPFLLRPRPQVYDSAADQAQLEQMVAQLDTQAASAQTRYFAANRPATRPRQPLKRFDPNKINQEEWEAMGLSRFVARNLVKYREKAGGFRYKEQLARIYGMPPELYRELYPFIDLPEQGGKTRTFSNRRPALEHKPIYPAYKKREPYRLELFDINTADTTQLKKIRGIGSRLSTRIVKFRDKLGGFTSKDQLSEVYGLSPEVLDSLQKYVFIQPGYSPQVLSINQASLAELQAHPYIGYGPARLILAYRTQHGPFQRLEDLARIRQLNPQQLEKLRPYLRL